MIQARTNKNNIEIVVKDKAQARKIIESLSAFEPGYEHNTLYRMGRWDGKKKFYNVKPLKDGWFFTAEIGFKKRLEQLLGVKIKDEEPNYDDIKKFIKGFLPELPFTPYRHQLKLVLEASQAKAHLGVSSVGSGKSLVMYMLLRYFRSKGKRCLVLVPTIDLTSQLHGDCQDYNAPDWFMADIQLIGGEFTNKEIHKSMVFSTWQSAQKSDMSSFDIVLNDECLHPETLISTKNGQVEIQNLNPGDLVWTINEQTQKKELKPIVKVHKNISSEQMYQIETTKGTIRITANHKVLTQRGWVRADELTTDDIIKE